MSFLFANKIRIYIKLLNKRLLLVNETAGIRFKPIQVVKWN